MPRLDNFSFNILSSIYPNNPNDLPSNEDIQHTFRDFKHDQIITCVNYFSEIQIGQCRVYSYPFTMESYENISNNFPDGLFTYVLKVVLYDERSFEHEFFLLIAQSFLLMEKLSIVTEKPQNNQKLRKSEDNNQNVSILKYPHLAYLDLYEVHNDYVEQFLLDIKTCLPNNIYLGIDYQSLEKVIHNFKRDETRINCSKANYI